MIKIVALSGKFNCKYLHCNFVYRVPSIECMFVWEEAISSNVYNKVSKALLHKHNEKDCINIDK